MAARSLSFSATWSLPFSKSPSPSPRTCRPFSSLDSLWGSLVALPWLSSEAPWQTSGIRLIEVLPLPFSLDPPLAVPRSVPSCKFKLSFVSSHVLITRFSGGFIVESYLGWRWTAWITLIASGAFMILAFIVVPETYGPVILQQRAARLRVETKNWAYHATLDENPPKLGDIGTRYLLRPFQMLFLEPILLLVTIYLALIYGILYLTFEAYPISFQEVRGWSHAGVAALPFLSILVGVFIGGAIIVFVTKTRFARKMKQQGRVVPEERLPPMILGSILLPIGLFWFGWTSNKNISWVPQVIAGVPIGAGILVIFMQGLNYIIDVYLMYANSAIAGNTLVRSALGGAFPLFATQMYHKLGVNWASSLLGFLTVAMVPIPILFYVYGARLRAMSRFNPRK